MGRTFGQNYGHLRLSSRDREYLTAGILTMAVRIDRDAELIEARIF